MTDTATTDPRTAVPTFDLNHRLARSLEWSAVDSTEMAELLGVSETTLRNYLKARTTPRAGMVRQWALRCGVPYEWLVTGDVPMPNPDDHGSVVTRRYKANVIEVPFGLRSDTYLAPAV